MKFSRKPLGLIVFTALLLSGVVMLSLVWGTVMIPPADVLGILWHRSNVNPLWRDIIWQFRLPKTIVAVCAGSALGVSGLQLQTLFRNPLAGPFILGISSGASLGVAVAVMAMDFLPPILREGSVVGAAFLGALGVLLLLLWVGRSVANNAILLMVGLLLGYVAISLISILIHFTNTDRLQRYIAWSAGSFSGITLAQLNLFVPFICLGLLMAMGLISSLNVLLLGENYAVSLGLNLPLVRMGLVVSSSLLAATVTAYCGPIGFLGVVVPHLCRGLWRTNDHRWLTPATILCGALLATGAGILAQVGDVVLPLNAVTTLLGSPVVAWVIFKKR